MGKVFPSQVAEYIKKIISILSIKVHRVRILKLLKVRLVIYQLF